MPVTLNLPLWNPAEIMVGTIDRHDKEIVDILKSLLEFLKKNATLLKTLQKDYKEYFPKSDSP